MRELTGDTIIRVRRPRPELRKRELTGDTRIRLSQIKDLREWVEDRHIYGMYEISPNTGLMKTEHGWVVPPHSMAPGSQRPIEETHRIGGGRGSSSSTGKTAKKKDDEYLRPDGTHDWTQKVPEWLDFYKNQVKISVEYNGKRVEMNIPEELLRDPYTQKMTDEAYQRNTKDLKQQIQYLQGFDFSKATPEQVSDALRLMGKVNAAAFKGEDRESNPELKLSEEEQQRNEKIYKKTKDVFIPKLIDYCIKHKVKVSYYKQIVFFENPITDVQISFHGYKGYQADLLTPANKDTWTHVKASYVYKNKKEAAKLDPIVKTYLNRRTTDHLIIKDKVDSVKDMEAKKIRFLVEWGDGQYEPMEFHSVVEAQQWWKETDEEGIMNVDKIFIRETKEEIPHY